MRAEDGEGLLDLARSIACRPRRRRAGGAARRRRCGRVAASRRRRVRPRSRCRADRGLEGVCQGGDAGRRCADGAALAVARPPCVVKADGLAAGKGVFVCRTEDELDARSQRGRGLPRAARHRGAARRCGGVAVRALRRRAGDRARPRAGLQARLRRRRGAEHRRHGLIRAGARLGEQEVEELLDLVHRPVLAELAERGSPFVGAAVRRD